MKETSIFFLNIKHNNYIVLIIAVGKKLKGGGVLATNRSLSPNFHYIHHNLMCCIPTSTPPTLLVPIHTYTEHLRTILYI